MNTTPAPGARIRLLAMRDDPDPIRVGQTGVVISVTQHHGPDAWQQIAVAWDDGRTLMLVSPPDEFEIVDDAMV